MEYTLTEPERTIPKSVLIYSAHKMGKSSIVSELSKQIYNGLPSAIVVDLEDSYEAVKVCKVKVSMKLNNKKKYDVLEKYLTEFEEDKKVKNIPAIGVVDSLTLLHDVVEYMATVDYMNTVQGKAFNRFTDTEITDIWNNETPYVKDDDTVYKPNKADLAKALPQLRGKIKPYSLWQSVITLTSGQYNVGSSYYREAMNRFKIRFESIFDYVIYIGHKRDKMEEINGTQINKKEVDLWGKSRDLFVRAVDAIAVMYAKNNQRILSFQAPEDDTGSGSRYDYLQGRDIVISEKTDKGIITNWKEIYNFL